MDNLRRRFYVNPSGKKCAVSSMKKSDSFQTRNLLPFLSLIGPKLLHKNSLFIFRFSFSPVATQHFRGEPIFPPSQVLYTSSRTQTENAICRFDEREWITTNAFLRLLYLLVFLKHWPIFRDRGDSYYVSWFEWDNEHTRKLVSGQIKNCLVLVTSSNKYGYK